MRKKRRVSLAQRACMKREVERPAAFAETGKNTRVSLPPDVLLPSVSACRLMGEIRVAPISPVSARRPAFRLVPSSAPRQSLYNLAHLTARTSARAGAGRFEPQSKLATRRALLRPIRKRSTRQSLGRGLSRVRLVVPTCREAEDSLQTPRVGAVGDDSLSDLLVKPTHTFTVLLLACHELRVPGV